MRRCHARDADRSALTSRPQERDPLPDDPAFVPCICHGETLESVPEWVLRQLPSPTWPVEDLSGLPAIYRWATRWGSRSRPTPLPADPLHGACVEGLP